MEQSLGSSFFEKLKAIASLPILCPYFSENMNNLAKLILTNKIYNSYFMKLLETLVAFEYHQL